MKSAITIVFGVLATAISAAPAISMIERQAPAVLVSVQLVNDLLGSRGDVTIPADGVERSVKDLFGPTSVAAGGSVVATSVQLTAFPQGVFCIMTEGARQIAIFNFQKTFADLDGNPDAAIPQTLDGAVLKCER